MPLDWKALKDSFMVRIEIKVYLREREWDTKELKPTIPQKEMKFWYTLWMILKTLCQVK